MEYLIPFVLYTAIALFFVASLTEAN